jgi:hypothetical protein
MIMALVSGLLVIAVIEAGGVDQSVTVFHVEKVTRHFQLPGTYRISNAHRAATVPKRGTNRPAMAAIRSSLLRGCVRVPLGQNRVYLIQFGVSQRVSMCAHALLLVPT